MGKGFNANGEKMKSAVRMLQKSKTCWNIKDLEKQLTSVCSINGMQVKGATIPSLLRTSHFVSIPATHTYTSATNTHTDYLTQLQSDNLLQCEKIGSGNWYWSFASDAQRSHEKAFKIAKSEHAKIRSAVTELQHKLASITAAQEDDTDSQDYSGEGRDELNDRKTILDDEVSSMKKELAAFAEDDPTELEAKKKQAVQFWKEADQITEDVQVMEEWFKKNSGDPGFMSTFAMMYYGDEWDSEEYCLRELEMPAFGEV